MKPHINTIIIDDEESARDTLKGIFGYFFPEIKVIGEADSVEDGITLLKETTPDLLFLDVKMPNGTGFDILEKLDEINFGIIFVTAFDQYAANAFRCAALDFLVKPVKVIELREAIQKYKTQHNSNILTHVHVLRDNLENSQKEILKMVLPTLDGFHVVDIKNIIRLEGMRNYTKFFLDEGKDIVVSKTMKEYEALLAEYGFLRVHLSYIINLRHVKRYIKGKGGEVEMSDGAILAISRNKKKIFLDRFI